MRFQLAFFEVTAQLVPVLLLAFVFESRDRHDQMGKKAAKRAEREEEPADRVQYAFALCLLVLAEILALSKVASGRPTDEAGYSVVMVLSIATLVWISGPMAAIVRRTKDRWEKAVIAAVFLAVVVMLLALVAWALVEWVSRQ
jgi:zinc transporter ZupT